MDRHNQDRVQRTLDFIQKDREIPEDPWFYSRLTARLEKESANSHSQGWVSAAAIRFRLVLVAIALIMGVTGGIELGRFFSTHPVSPAQEISGLMAEEDAAGVMFRELSGSFDEQILLMK